MSVDISIFTRTKHLGLGTQVSDEVLQHKNIPIKEIIILLNKKFTCKDKVPRMATTTA